MRCAVIVVHYGRVDVTLRCLESIVRGTLTPDAVVLVDNSGNFAEATGSLNQPAYFTLITPGNNVGFARGCNLAAEQAIDDGIDLLWFVNNDAVLRHDALSQMLGAVVANAGHDFFGSYISMREDMLWFAGGSFNQWTGRTHHLSYGLAFQPAAAGPAYKTTDWVTGCSLMVRAPVFSQLGGFDEQLFLYGEDLDLQLRAADQRCRRPSAILIPSVLIEHDVGGSTGGTNSSLGRAFMARNRLRLIKRHSGGTLPLWLLRWTWEFLAHPALHAQWGLIAAALRGASMATRPGESLVQVYDGRTARRFLSG